MGNSPRGLLCAIDWERHGAQQSEGYVLRKSQRGVLRNSLRRHCVQQPKRGLLFNILRGMLRPTTWEESWSRQPERKVVRNSLRGALCVAVSKRRFAPTEWGVVIHWMRGVVGNCLRNVLCGTVWYVKISIQWHYASKFIIIMKILIFIIIIVIISILKLIKIQLDTTVRSLILMQNHSTCFGCQPHPSSGVVKTVTAASGTGHTVKYKD